jgi:inosine-uridine nucleoside N-ribohydrolase
VVTAVNNTPQKTRLTAKLLERLGRTDVPIGTGVQTSDEPITQRDWLGGYSLDGYAGVVLADGVQALIDTIMQSPEPVTIITIGPVTNIGAALEREPRIAERARVISMAGSLEKAVRGNPGPIPECNVVNDVEAFQALLAAPWDVTITPLDGCGDIVLEGERFKRVAESPAPAAKAVTENYAAWDHRRHHPEDSSSVLFDTVAVYLAYDDALCEMQTLNLTVDDEGYTRERPEGRTVRCQLGWKDEAAFKDLIVNSLVQGGEE